MVFTGIVATAICNMFWNRAIAELGVARTSLYQYWIPVFGVGFAMLLLGEPFTAWHLVGLLGILLGTYLGTRRPVRPKAEPAQCRHRQSVVQGKGVSVRVEQGGRR